MKTLFLIFFPPQLLLKRFIFTTIIRVIGSGAIWSIVLNPFLMIVIAPCCGVISVLDVQVVRVCGCWSPRRGTVLVNLCDKCSVNRSVICPQRPNLSDFS